MSETCQFVCSSDDDCGDGKLCIDDECVAGCRASDCGGYTLYQPAFADKAVGIMVQGDQVCNEDDLCVDCITNDDCDAGYTCTDSYCWIDEPLSCAKNAETAEIAVMATYVAVTAAGGVVKFLCSRLQ